MPFTRQLATIMSSDIVGCTALMQEKETAAAVLSLRHPEVFQKEHWYYHCEVVQYYGDGNGIP